MTPQPITPPPGYVEKSPLRGPWFSIETPPKRYAAPSLLMPDSSVCFGTLIPAEPPIRPRDLW